MDENMKDVLGTEPEVEEEELMDDVVIYEEEAEEEHNYYEEYEEMYEKVEELTEKISALRKTNRVLSVFVALVLCAAAAFGGFKIYKAVYNPYNHMGYYNMSGMTLEDFALQNGVEVEDIIDDYNLPEDVKGNTYLDVVEYLIPVKTFAQMYGLDVETVAMVLGLPEGITGEETVGEAFDMRKLSDIYPEQADLDSFIVEYDLGSSVTGETLWGEVRGKVNKIEYERYMAAMATDVVDDAVEGEVEGEAVEDATVAQ